MILERWIKEGSMGNRAFSKYHLMFWMLSLVWVNGVHGQEGPAGVAKKAAETLATEQIGRAHV